MKGKHHKKASGGRTHMKVSGNPDVFEEAEDKHGTAKKSGGRVKRAKGGKVDLGFMHGGAVRPRLDRPGRKMGGRVGADKSPLSSAHRDVSSSEGSSKPADTYGGERAD